MKFVKWKLMLTTLPFVAAAVLVKVLLENFRDFHGIIEFSDIGMVITGGVFLIGVMLAGTMADFKESEKLPGEIATTLETIEDTIETVGQAKPGFEMKEQKVKLLKLSTSIHDWLYKKITQEQLFQEIENAKSIMDAIEKTGATAYAIRGLNELHNIRKMVTRVGVISRTGFLSTGYALLEVLTTVIIVLLILSKFKSFLVEVILVSFVTQIFVYMLRLIKDIDDPFEYEEGAAKGAAEVELFPLEEYIIRAKTRI